ncbi:MAG TPA: restriction endonuclease [Rhodoferax sp.]|jgi:restriction system protein|nr:restriction endonuclease [Rhodoferax sp.]HQC86307.1 restriction endonuclease [Rhodoferax sp.]HQY76441.1 restriction endonuclease [Rhodoferax sp.]
MAIPDYESLMLPLLKQLADGSVRVLKDVIAALADECQLTAEERAQLLPSGGTLTFHSRVGWAKTYLKKAGLLTQPKRGMVQISAAGTEVLAENLDALSTKYLYRLESFQDFRNGNPSAEGETKAGASAPVSVEVDLTPDEVIDAAFEKSREALADDVLERVKACSPSYFERLVVQLLIKMGYGGSREEAGRAVGKSGDGGIDGIINEDRLGLDAIYLQAKRWEGVVGRPEIMKFVGALAGQRASKGVFITTSWYTQEAKDYAANSQYKVVLIDGPRLSDLMIEHDLGVSVAATYQLKRIDSDFFADE